MQGLQRTASFKFEGGDADWEEKKLGSYANSEVRFVEIHEKLCSEVVEGKAQCYQLLEEYEEVIYIKLKKYHLISLFWAGSRNMVVQKTK